MIVRLVAAGILTAALFAHALPARADVTGLVRGRVLVDGTPRAGITVTASTGNEHASAVTDRTGAFVFPRLAFGRWTLAAALDGRSATSAVTVTSDSVATIDLSLTARTIGATRNAPLDVGGNPVSVTTLTSADIQAAPQNQNLNRLIETVPGIVRFSYDEPVAHGFHGVTYEIDGAPLPQTTSTSFSQVFDPNNVDSLEVFTDSLPAEFGGQRAGAVVNIISKRDVDIPNGSQTVVAAGAGSYSDRQANLDNETRVGNTTFFLDGNIEETLRGLDAPSPLAIHDAASLSDAFLRTITRLGPNDTLAFDLSDQDNTYQIPINLTVSPVDTIVNAPAQDDVQLEYNAFASLDYTHTARDGNGYVQVIPWWRSSRTVYAGDLGQDVLAADFSADDCGGAAPCTLDGLRQNRGANVYGLRLVDARSTPVHALKFGLDGSFEAFTSAETIQLPGTSPFLDDVAKTGTTFDAYAEDTWTPNRALSVQAGLRYDLSDGFVEGNLLQPRIGFNLRVGPTTIVHAYYGRLYAAPDLEDTRRDAVVAGGGSLDELPVYDLKPSTESDYDTGIRQALPNDISASVDVWQRNVWNVLDTTQIYPTPIFAVYTNALGLAHGVELRLDRTTADDRWYLSASYAQSVAGGISGGTFLFAPSDLADTSLQPEDHDQALAIDDAYTRRFGRGHRWYATLGSDYGTGYPVAFQNGNGRLTPHLTFDAALGRTPERGSIGFRLSALNLTDDQYVIKVNNGFNTTQFAAGLQLLGELQLAF